MWRDYKHYPKEWLWRTVLFLIRNRGTSETIKHRVAPRNQHSLFVIRGKVKMWSEYGIRDIDKMDIAELYLFPKLAIRAIMSLNNYEHKTTSRTNRRTGVRITVRRDSQGNRINSLT